MKHIIGYIIFERHINVKEQSHVVCSCQHYFKFNHYCSTCIIMYLIRY